MAGVHRGQIARNTGETRNNDQEIAVAALDGVFGGTFLGGSNAGADHKREHDHNPGIQ
jgi:hypothetical protein